MASFAVDDPHYCLLYSDLSMNALQACTLQHVPILLWGYATLVSDPRRLLMKAAAHQLSHCAQDAKPKAMANSL